MSACIRGAAGGRMAGRDARDAGVRDLDHHRRAVRAARSRHQVRPPAGWGGAGAGLLLLRIRSDGAGLLQLLRIRSDRCWLRLRRLRLGVCRVHGGGGERVVWCPVRELAAAAARPTLRPISTPSSESLGLSEASHQSFRLAEIDLFRHGEKGQVSLAPSIQYSTALPGCSGGTPSWRWRPCAACGL